jgi:hypothetical protein
MWGRSDLNRDQPGSPSEQMSDIPVIKSLAFCLIAPLNLEPATLAGLCYAPDYHLAFSQSYKPYSQNNIYFRQYRCATTQRLRQKERLK